MRKVPAFRLPLLLFTTLAITASVILVTLWVAAKTYGLGFPLDDAWIHQTYARNLAQFGEWAFELGQPSSGSTSPLWTLMLAWGYWLGLDPKVWSYFLGGVLLATSAWFCGRWLGIRMKHSSRWVVWAAWLFLFEWHMVWSAVSGMEILALTLIVVLLLSSLDTEKWNGWVVGSLIGIGIWLRPDALSLLVPVGWHAMFFPWKQMKDALRYLIAVLVGLTLVVIPYLIFNYVFSGAWLPSTFYAKQAEYAVMRLTPLLFRLVDQFSLPIVGIGIILLPGVFLVVRREGRRGSWRGLAPLIWAISFLGMYALRLPVRYQHGRYAMPTIPVILVLGLEGLLTWIKFDVSSMWTRVISRAWSISLGIVMFAFLWLGISAYSRDVAFIETEMVATARWISQNTESDALVAAHDIGALGYFGSRSLLDLAGLVSPQVIPFIQDEEALGSFLDRKGADYLMTFPEWYPALSSVGVQVFTTNGRFSRQAGGENMVVYRWVSGGFAP